MIPSWVGVFRVSRDGRKEIESASGETYASTRFQIWKGPPQGTDTYTTISRYSEEFFPEILPRSELFLNFKTFVNVV
jgi:hypothetical protein